MDTQTIDWMTVTISGYNPDKGYMYAIDNLTGNQITIAKSHSSKKDWLEKMQSQQTPTFTPKGSVVALFNLSQKKNNFYIATGAAPVLKMKPGSNGSVYLGPVRISGSPRELRQIDPQNPSKTHYITATVLDPAPLEIKRIQDIAHLIEQGISKEGVAIRGSRGFQLRVRDNSGKGVSAWEFSAKRGQSLIDSFHENLSKPPAAGQQFNYMQNVINNIASAINNQDYVAEVSGFTNAPISDFGSQNVVERYASLPNYKGPSGDPAYNMSAITITDDGRINNILPLLPSSKASKIGMLGNHHPAISAPTTVQATPHANTPIETKSNVKVIHKYPLIINAHTNKNGHTTTFRIKSTDGDISKYEDAIRKAGGTAEPFFVSSDSSWSYSMSKIVEVSEHLKDLVGEDPVYVVDHVINGETYIAIEGLSNHPVYKDSILHIQKKHSALIYEDKIVFPKSSEDNIAADLKEIINDVRSREYGTVPSEQAKKPDGKPRVNYGQWLNDKFGGDPYRILDFVMADVTSYAEAAGVDWEKSASAIVFESPGLSAPLLKTPRIRPIRPKDIGSLAVGALFTETFDPKYEFPLHNIVLTFMRGKPDSVKEVYSAAKDLRAEYEREMGSNLEYQKPSFDKEAFEKKQAVKAAEREAEREKIKADKKASLDNFRSTFKKLPPALGSTIYLKKKLMDNIGDYIDIRAGGVAGVDQFAAFELIDMDRNVVGYQRLLDHPTTNENGKLVNKKFVYGTNFSDPDTEEPLGTHAILGNINSGTTIRFTEGLADASSSLKATGQSTVVCLNTGNMEKVMRLYRQKYPTHEFIINADNDVYKPEKGNPGMLSALDNARATNALIAIPSFKGMSVSGSPTDFNDMESIKGLNYTQDQLQKTMTPPANLIDFLNLRMSYVGTETYEDELEKATTLILEENLNGSDTQIIKNLLMSEVDTLRVKQAMLKASQENIQPPENIEKKKLLLIKDPDLKVTDITSKPDKNGKVSKFTLIKGDKKFEGTVNNSLKKIFPNHKFNFNNSAGGWIAPFVYQKIISTYLASESGSPRIYIGNAINKNIQLPIIRGDFTDESFRNEIAEKVPFANIEYLPSEFGFVMHNAAAQQVVETALREYLEPEVFFDLENQDLQKKTSLQLNAVSDSISVPVSEIVKAHHLITLSDKFSVVGSNDFLFSGLLARSLNSHKHIESNDDRLEAALKTMVAHQSKSHIYATQEKGRVDEILGHIEIILNKDTDQLNIDSKDVTQIINRIAYSYGITSGECKQILTSAKNSKRNPLYQDVILEFQEKISHIKLVTKNEEEFGLETEVAEPEIEATEPEVEAAEPEIEAAEPEIEVAEPEVEVAEPEIEVAEPEIEVAEPEVEVAEPEVEVAEPEVEVAEPEIEVAEPEIEVAEPEIEAAEPEIEVAEPEIEVAEPEVETTEENEPDTELDLEPVTDHALDSILTKTDKEIEIIAAKLGAQEIRISELIESIEIAIRNEYDEEEVYDRIISQPGSPYYTNGKFNHDIYRHDLASLDKIDTLQNWNPSLIKTTSQLYNKIHKVVAIERIEQLKEIITDFLNESERSFRSFQRYITSKSIEKDGYVNPYCEDPDYPEDINYEVLEKDLLAVFGEAEQITKFPEYFEYESNLWRDQQIVAPQEDLFQITDDYSVPDVIATTSSSEAIGSSSIIKGTEESGFYLAEKINPSDGKLLSAIFNKLEESEEFLREDFPTSPQRIILGSGLERNPFGDLEIRDHELLEVSNDEGSIYIVHNTMNSSVQIFSSKDSALLELDFIETDINNSASSEIQESSEEVKALENGLPLDIANRLEEKASDEVAFEEAVSEIETAISPDGEYPSIGGPKVKSAYEDIIAKKKSDSDLAASAVLSNFEEFGKIVQFACDNKMPYPEFYEETFKEDGIYTDLNPYFDEDRSRINRKGMLADMKKAGFESLTSYYSSVYETINNVSPSEEALQRVGGFIPTEIDYLQPLRPQFDSLERVINESPVDSKPSPVKQVPFADWIVKNDSLSPIHSILKLDGQDINQEDLSNYSLDSLMIYADISGVNFKVADPSKEDVINSIKSLIEVKEIFQGLSLKEIMDIDIGVIENSFEKLNISAPQGEINSAKKILEHTENLTRISALRAAQYSYIANAISHEALNNKIPSFAYREISQLVSSEVDLLGIADNAIEMAVNERLATKIQDAISITNSSNPIRLAVAESLMDIGGKIIEIGDNPNGVSFDSDSRDAFASSLSDMGKNKEDARKYEFVYKLSPSLAKKPKFPSGVSSYMDMGDGMVGLQSPLSNQYMIDNKAYPISVDATRSSLSPIGDWIKSKGYAGFYDKANNLNVILTEKKNVYQLSVDASGTQSIKKLSSIEESLSLIASNAQTFLGRDDIIADATSKIALFEGFSLLNQDWEMMSKDKIASVVNAFADADQHFHFEKILDGTYPDWEKASLISNEIEKEISTAVWDQITGHSKDVIIPPYLYEVTKKLAAIDGVFEKEALSDIGDGKSDIKLEVIESWEKLKDVDNPDFQEELLESFFNNLSAFDKNLLAVNISNGIYENTDHFLHSQYILALVESGNPTAQEIQEKLYPFDSMSMSINEIYKPHKDQENNVLPGILIPRDRLNQDHKVMIGMLNKDNDSFSEFIEPHWQKDPATRERSKFTFDGQYIPKMTFEDYEKLQESRVPLKEYIDIPNINEKALSALSSKQLKEVAATFDIRADTGNLDEESLTKQIVSMVKSIDKDLDLQKIYNSNVAIQNYAYITSNNESMPVYEAESVPATHESFHLPIKCAFELHGEINDSVKSIKGQLEGTIDERVGAIYTLDSIGLNEKILELAASQIPSEFDIDIKKSNNKTTFTPSSLLNAPTVKPRSYEDIDSALSSVKQSFEIKLNEASEDFSDPLDDNFAKIFTSHTLSYFKGSSNELMDFIQKEISECSGPVSQVGSVENTTVIKEIEQLISDVKSVQDSLPSAYDIVIDGSKFYAHSKSNPLNIDLQTSFSDVRDLGRELLLINSLQDDLGIEGMVATVDVGKKEVNWAEVGEKISAELEEKFGSPEIEKPLPENKDQNPSDGEEEDNQEMPVQQGMKF